MNQHRIRQDPFVLGTWLPLGLVSSLDWAAGDGHPRGVRCEACIMYPDVSHLAWTSSAGSKRAGFILPARCSLFFCFSFFPFRSVSFRSVPFFPFLFFDPDVAGCIPRPKEDARGTLTMSTSGGTTAVLAIALDFVGVHVPALYLRDDGVILP